MDEQYTVAGMIRRHAEERPDRSMLIQGDRTVTWAEEHRRAGAVAHTLLAEGIGPGDRVAFLDRNGLAYFDTLFGAALLGAVHVAVNWRLAPAEIAAVIDDSEAPLLVVAPEFLPCLRAMESPLPAVRRIVVLDNAGVPGDAPLSEGIPIPTAWSPRATGWRGDRITIPGRAAARRMSACSSTPRARRASRRA